MVYTLEEAIKRIEELEKENTELKEEIAVLRSRKAAGRGKHDKKWTESYQDFVIKYEGGMSIMEIVSEGRISRRTAYRYKEYYDKLTKQFQEK